MIIYFVGSGNYAREKKAMWFEMFMGCDHVSFTRDHHDTVLTRQLCFVGTLYRLGGDGLLIA